VSSSLETAVFTDGDAQAYLHPPRETDDKYSRGVVGFITGSPEYPGAAVLGVSAALHLGVGMARFVGDEQVSDLVLQYRPEVVCREGDADARVLGSGIDPTTRTLTATNRLRRALASESAIVLDAGALDLISAASNRTVITPHVRELSRLFSSFGEDVSPEEIRANPTFWAHHAASKWQVFVLLKGHQTVLAAPESSQVLLPRTGSEWLSTAGTGDVLAGAIGAVLATVHAKHQQETAAAVSSETFLGSVAAAVTAHALASHHVLAPFTALALAEGLSEVRRNLSVEPKG
jgi:hydroxyethylthiazole kinase-like uncharacterized protein yjeF